MFSVKSLDQYEITGRGTVFVIPSPVTAERTREAMKAAIGERIIINDAEYEIKGFDINRPLYPVRIGENIGILVTKDAQQQR